MIVKRGFSADSNTTEAVLYLVTDGAGQLIAVADSSGRLPGTLHDDDFQIGIPGSGATSAAQTFNPQRWSSPGAIDTISTFRNRQYDPATGRWLQEDPIGTAGGVNLYQYNGNDPNSFSDPFGLQCPDCAWNEFQNALGLQHLPLIGHPKPNPIVAGVSATVGPVTGSATIGAGVGSDMGLSGSQGAGASFDIGVKVRNAGPDEPRGSFSVGMGKHLGVTVSNSTVMLNFGFGIGAPITGTISLGGPPAARAQVRPPGSREPSDATAVRP